MTGEIFRTASGALIETSGGGIPSRTGVVASAPVLTSVSPTAGVDTGGTLLTLTGTGFALATAVLLGGVAFTPFTVVSDTNITFTSPAHADGAVSIAVVNPAGTSGTVSYTYGPPGSGTVFVPLQIRNGQSAARTAPPVTAGHVFAPGEIPAGSYPEIRPTGTGSPIANFQWDQVSTRKDGSWYYAVASFKADGAFTAYKVTGDTHSYDLVSKTGTPPYLTSSVTPATIAAASQLYVKLYGVDFSAEAGGGSFYYGDFNFILANYPRDTWGTNPTGGWELVSSGAVCNKYWAWMCARRSSDNAIHKWLVVAFEVTAWATGEYTVNPVVLQPWIYGAHPSGTLGPAANAQPGVSAYISAAQPRYAGFYELQDLKSGTLIGARGGPNDTRSFTFSATAFEAGSGWFTLPSNVLSYPSSVPGGGMTTGTGWLFSAAAGGTLPSLIDPNWVYWIGNISSGHAQIALERAVTNSFQSYPGPSGVADSWTANAVIPNPAFGFTWVGRGNVGYVYVTSGTTGSSGPTPNPVGSSANAQRLDGTATYQQANPAFGTAGSGNVTATPVCATFGNTAVDFKDEFAQPYWFDPVNHTPAPWTLPMMDFDYATLKSKIVHPFEFHTPLPVPDTDPGIQYLAAVERYFPNDMLTDFGQGAWDVMRAPGDDIMDNRLGAWNQRQALRLYQPGDRNTAQNARVMAARFFGYHHWGWDHRSGRVPLINLGHNRAGSDYTGYPAGTINSTLTWYTKSTDNVGSPTPMGVGYDTNLTPFVFRHIAGYTSTYGQVVNGSHCPNPSMGDRVINGDYVALQEMQAIHFGVLSTPYAGLRNNIAGFPGLGGLVNHDAGQARANGWDTVKQCTILIFTPDTHLMKPYYKDNLEDQSTYFSGLSAWVSSSVGPKLPQWGLTGSLVATIGGITTLWGLAHQMEGMSYGAMALAGDYPGFKTATDAFLLNLMRIWDPNNGGCLYYVGLDFVSYGSTSAASSLPADLPTMAMQPNICGDPAASGTFNLFAQTPGGAFVCPGVGQSAPTFLQSDGRGSAFMSVPGANIFDGGGIFSTGREFCGGHVRIDATSVPMQIVAPVAVAANMPGADPRYSVLWHAARTRFNQGGMIGPTFAGIAGGAGSYGSFQYCYRPPT